MNNREMLSQLIRHYSNMSKDEFCQKIDEALEKIEAIVQLTKTSKEIIVEVYSAIKQGIKFGFHPHNLTKQKLKQVLSILENLAKAIANTEEEKDLTKFIEFLCSIANSMIDKNPHIRNNGEWYG